MQEQQERETDEETRTQKTRRKQKGKAKTRVAKQKWDSLLGPSKRARGVTMDSGDEGKVNNLYHWGQRGYYPGGKLRVF